MEGGWKEDVEVMRAGSRALGAHIVDLSGDWWRAEEGCWGCWFWVSVGGVILVATSSSSWSLELVIGIVDVMLRSDAGGVSGSMNSV